MSDTEATSQGWERCFVNREDGIGKVTERINAQTSYPKPLINLYGVPGIVKIRRRRVVRNITTMSDTEATGQGWERCFVNRENEIREVVNLVTSQASAPKTIINFYGVPGIGKTRLLRAIRGRLDNNRHSLFVDFASLAEDSTIPLAQHKAHVLHRLVRDASPQFFTDKLQHELEQLIHASTEPSDDTLDRLVGQIVQTVQDITTAQTQPVVLFFDTCEQASDAVFAWLERRILLPLSETNVVAVLASRSVLRWRHYAVRRKVEPLELKPLDEAATQAQVFPPKPTDEHQHKQASRIFEMTFGHPLSTEYLVVEQQATEQNEVGKAMRKAVITHLLERAKVPKDIHPVVETIALFRDFDIHTLRDVLPKCLPDAYNGKSQADYYNLLKQLLETHLIAWDNQKHAYVMDETIRKIIEFGLRVYDLSYYDKVNIAACDYYSRLVTVARTDERRVEFFEGYLFHLIQFAAMPDISATGTEPNQSHTTVQERLTANFKDVPNETRRAWWPHFSEVPAKLPEQPHSPLNSNRLSLPRSEQTEIDWEDLCTIIEAELRAFFDPPPATSDTESQGT